MSEYRAARLTHPPSRLALTAAAILAASLVAGCGKKSDVDPELTATLIQPVAQVKLQAATVAPGSRTGEQVYKSICASCHDSGALNAPKAGDAGAWGPRLGLGHEGLTKSAIAGKGNMPPRGGGSDLTDEEVKRAVAFLANKAGAGFTEPPVQ